MFYPFPRAASAPTGWPPAGRLPSATTLLPRHDHNDPRQAAQGPWAMPAAPAATARHWPCATLPPGAPLAVSKDQEENDDEGALEVNDDLVAYFVAMEARRAARASTRGRQASKPGQGGGDSSGNVRGLVRGSDGFVLPEQEDVASRAAQLERQQVRARQEWLYGAHAADARALEAALNRSFGRAVYSTNPVTWPAAPLRFV